MEMEGDIAELNLLGELVDLSRARFTGALRFEGDGIIKIVYFKEGSLLSASTNDRADSLDEVLLHAEKITRDHVRQALSRRAENETLGDALLALGFISKRELTWARRVQLVGVLRSVMTWTQGNFALVSDYLPKREEGTLFYTPQIVLEIVLTDPQRAELLEKLDSGRMVFRKADDFSLLYPVLGLNDDADKIMVKIDGRTSASDLAEQSSMDSFDTLKLLYALFVLGLLVREEKHEVIHEVTVGAVQPTDSPQLVLDFGSQSPVAAPESEVPVVALTDFPESDSDTELTGEILESNLTTGVTEEYVDTTEYDLTSDQESVSSLIDAGRGEDQVTAELPLPVVIPEAEPGSDSAEASGWPSTIGTLAVPADVVTLETPKKESATPVLEGPTFSREVPGTAERLDWLKENRESMFHRPQRTSNTVRNAIAIAAIVTAAGAGGWWYWSHEIAREISPAAPAARGGRMMVPIPPQAGQGSDDSTTTSPLPEAVETSGVSDTGPGEVIPTGPEGASSAEGASEETVTSSPVLPVAAATGTVVAASSKVTSKPVAQAQKPEKPSPPPYIALSRDAIRDGYDRRAETYKEDANPNEFSIQFALVCQTSSLTKALEGGGGAVWFGRVQYRDRPCYRVFWKRFNDRGIAETAIAEIPGALRAGSKPVVVRIGDVLPR